MQFSNLFALGALLSSAAVNASPFVQNVQHVNAIHKRELTARTTSPYIAQGCFQEGVVGGTITAGSGLISKVVPPPTGGMTVEYCGTNCVGYVLFGLEQVSGVTTCYCGNVLQSGVVSVASSQCTGTCTYLGVSTPCGDVLRLNVYLISGTGAAGAPGSSGLIGATGSRGASGISGLSGASGLPGASGLSGLSGASGLSGLSGASGLPGASGLRGLQGSNGLNGNDGASGLVGPTGSQGSPGAPGPTGAAGAPGTNGAPGSNGAQGPQGNSGVNGFNGAKGAIGNPGAPGTPGTPGTAGDDGINGAIGPVGPQGAQGNDGPQGAPGPCGVAELIDYGFEAIGTTDSTEIPWQITDPASALPNLATGPAYNFEDQAEANTGLQSGSVTWGVASTTTAGQYRQQHVIVCPGVTYDFQVFMFSTLANSPVCQITFNIGYPGAYTAIGIFDDVVNTGAFTEFTTTGQFTADIDFDLFFSVEIDCGAATTPMDGAIYFDDFRITPTAT